jgi:hypothetical protein
MIDPMYWVSAIGHGLFVLVLFVGIFVRLIKKDRRLGTTRPLGALALLGAFLVFVSIFLVTDVWPLLQTLAYDISATSWLYPFLLPVSIIGAVVFVVFGLWDFIKLRQAPRA